MPVSDEREDEFRNFDDGESHELSTIPPEELAGIEVGLAVAFANSPSESPTAFGPLEVVRAGHVFDGRYLLIEQIGEGGMGVVWYAEQQTPIKRKVALKLIKPGLDSKSVFTRFEAERQTLALMDHPNIAKVLDSGMSIGGSPYFVMELVRGTAITTFCDERKLDLYERLQLFIPVCRAIQHAHQKGIIHRDIKPSNVMIALFDDKPVPKVIDFGVAKACDAKALDIAAHTGFGSVVGTAEYMSPEQAQLNNIDIDTRSDVYSLGVLLYELVAGSPPFRRSDFEEPGLLDMLRAIRDVEPPRPSLKLSSSKMRASIAAMRKMEPTALQKLLRSELDWIVMKSLEKERVRRYDSADGLARDIERFLNNEPVDAYPPSTFYKLKKFLGRNRATVTAAALLLLTLVTGIIGTSIGLYRAEAARRVAEKAQKIASELADGERQAKLEALAQKELAQAAELATIASYRASTDDAIEQLIGSKPKLGYHEKIYLENALSRWQTFADQQGNDIRSRAIRGEGHQYLGLIWEQLGQYAQARSALEVSASIWEQLAAEFPSEPDYRNNSTSVKRSLAIVLRKLGDYETAENQITQAMQAQKQTGSQFPGDMKCKELLGLCHATLATLLKHRGSSKAVEQYREALRIFEGLAAEAPHDFRYRYFVTCRQADLGNFLAENGHITDVEQLFRRSLATMSALSTEHPDDPVYRHGLADRHVTLGRFLRAKLAKPEDGMAELRLGLENYEKLAVEFPSVPTYRKELADGRIDLGQILISQGRWDEAEEQIRSAIQINQDLLSEFADAVSHRVSLGWSYCRLAELMNAQGKTPESLQWFDKAVETMRPAYERNTRSAFSREGLVYILAGRANALAKLKQDKPADWEMVREFILPDGPQQSQIQRSILWLRAGKVDDAVNEMETLIAQSQAVMPPWSLVEWFDAACFFSIASSKDSEHEAEYGARAVELLKRAVAAGFTDAGHIQHDADLDPVRQRSDFKYLLDSLNQASNASQRAE